VPAPTPTDSAVLPTSDAEILATSYFARVRMATQTCDGGVTTDSLPRALATGRGNEREDDRFTTGDIGWTTLESIGPTNLPIEQGIDQDVDRGASDDVAVVLAHGFTGGRRVPAVGALVSALRPRAAVFVPDLRGHGDSSGVCTFGDREVLDVDAVVGEARRRGFRRVVTLGCSMGGSVVIRHAALARHGARARGFPVRNPVDAVISVSSPSRWYARGTPAMRRVMWLAETALGRRVAATLLNTRLGADVWPDVPPSPVEVIGLIAPTPVLIVHGDQDGYFGLDHAHALAAAAGAPSWLWLPAGFGHAEAALTPDLAEAIGAALPDLLAGRPLPPPIGPGPVRLPPLSPGRTGRTGHAGLDGAPSAGAVA